MSGKSSSPDAWWSALEPAPAELFRGRGDPDDLRLGEIVRRWDGNGEPAPGRAALIGFPCDEGVRRNHGRPGAALAPRAIRESLYRLTPWDPSVEVDLRDSEITDIGDIRIDHGLEVAQKNLGTVVGALLRSSAVPVILGGGHETAYGHYLGYVQAGIECAIVNIDAHLDVREYSQGAHSGSPFRQAMEHPTHPLKQDCYVVFGAQSQSVARAHAEYVKAHGGRIQWSVPQGNLARIPSTFSAELVGLGEKVQAVMLTVDSDAFRQADVPGCSAPNPLGFDGVLWPEIAFRAGSYPAVRSIDLVEVNPSFDRDGQTARWAAVGIRQFLVGLAKRPK